MLEGVEVSPSGGIGIVLPTAPDIENPLPLAVVERDSVDALQVEPDRHSSGAVRGDVIGCFVAGIGNGRVEHRFPGLHFQMPRFPLRSREEQRGQEEQDHEERHPSREPDRLVPDEDSLRDGLAEGLQGRGGS